MAAAVGQFHCDLFGVLYNVMVGHDESGLIDDETRSGADTAAAIGFIRNAKEIKGINSTRKGGLSPVIPIPGLARKFLDRDLDDGRIQLGGNLRKRIRQRYGIRNRNRSGFLFEGRFNSA